MLPPQNRPLFRHTLSYALLPTRRLRYEPLGGEGLGVNLHKSEVVGWGGAVLAVLLQLWPYYINLY